MINTKWIFPSKRPGQHLSISIPLVLYLTIVLFINNFTITLQQQKKDLVSDLLGIFTNETIEARIPCIMYTNCATCVKNSTCKWISGSPTNGLVVFMQNGDKPMDVRQTSFCWAGRLGQSFWDKNRRTIENVTSKNGEPMNITAVFGFNDWSWRCSIRAGALLVVIAPLCFLLIMFSTIFVLYKLFRYLYPKKLERMNRDYSWQLINENEIVENNNMKS
jgi:hypothetical protein